MRPGLASGSAVLVALAAAGALAACAGPAPHAPAAPGSGPSTATLDGGGLDGAAGAPALPPLLPFDALAARGATFALGMRETARGDMTGSSPPPVVASADAADTCARVALVAEPPAHAWLTDKRGTVLADVAKAEDTALGPHGPVCVRKGDAISLHVERTGPWSARFVAWGSP